MGNGSRGKRPNLEDLREEIAGVYPDLRVTNEGGVIHVRGSFPIVHEGEVLDRFQITIELPHDFPKTVPVIREIGGRIPWIPDRHINPNGEACVLVPEEWMVLRESEQTLRAFLD